MMTAARLKGLAGKGGADLCGIAPVHRFSQAPPGFGPTDIWADAKSVVVVAKRLPGGVFFSENPVPYTFASDTTVQTVSRLVCGLAVRLEDLGVAAVPVPSEPYVYWDDERREGKGILSLKHAGRMAGLGTMGKNTLLTNDVFGNRISLGALLVDVDLEVDAVSDFDLGCEKCGACIDSCPAGALDGDHVDQKLCRSASVTVTKKGYTLYTCRACRSVCPKGRGRLRRPVTDPRGQ